IEQDNRAIKRRVNASQGFRSFDGAWRTLQGYEVLHMIRKGPSAVVTETGCHRPSPVRQRDLRPEGCVKSSSGISRDRLNRPRTFCNTSNLPLVYAAIEPPGAGANAGNCFGPLVIEPEGGPHAGR